MSYTPNKLEKSAFGELVVAQLAPITQILWLYGLRDTAFSFSEGSGSASVSDGMLVADSGAATNSAANVFNKRFGKYRAGVGLVARYSALFDTPESGSRQIAGLVSALDNISFGYNSSAQFGIFYEYGGVQESQDLQFTTPSGGAENATITVDGTPYTVPLTGAGTVQDDAYEAAVSLNSQIGAFAFSSNDDTVSCVSEDTASSFGSFAFSSATAVAAWTRVVATAEPTETFITQGNWNRDTMTTLDQQKLNVYQVRMEYLGAGAIDFFIEEPTSGDFTLVHRLEIANSRTTPSLSNPNLRIGFVSENSTNHTSIQLKSASAGLFMEGNAKPTEKTRSVDGVQLSVGTTATNIFTIKNRVQFNNTENRTDTEILSITAFTDGNKGAILEVWENATPSGNLDFEYIDEQSSTTEAAYDNVTVSGGDLIYSASVGGSSLSEGLTPLDIVISPRTIVTVSMRVPSGAAADMNATLSLREGF